MAISLSPVSVTCVPLRFEVREVFERCEFLESRVRYLRAFQAERW